MALPSEPFGYLAVAAVGAAMLLLNTVMLATRHEINVLTSVLGATGLVAGTAALAGVTVDVFALFFIVLGLVLVAIPVMRAIRHR